MWVSVCCSNLEGSVVSAAAAAAAAAAVTLPDMSHMHCTHLISIGPCPPPPPITWAKPDSCPGLACPKPGAPPRLPNALPDGAPNAHPAPALPFPRPVFCVFCNRGTCREFCWVPYVFMFMDRRDCAWLPASSIPLSVAVSFVVWSKSRGASTKRFFLPRCRRRCGCISLAIVLG